MKTNNKILIALLSLTGALACPAQNPITCTPTPPPLPTPTCTPTPLMCPTESNPVGAQSPAPTPIPNQFQPPPPETTKLAWRIFEPTDGAGKWPVVLLIHAGGFKTGSYYDGSTVHAAQSLAAEGYYALVVSYRLAPCKTIFGQHPHDNTPDGIASGRPPQQTDDIQALVRAARADTHCLNQKVGIVGGSAGGSHAAFVAFDTTASVGWPNWQPTDRPNATVCLSGAYDFADRTDEPHLQDFVDNIENYTGTCVRIDPNPDPAVKDQRRVSPIAKLTSDIKPMYFIHTDLDPMPHHQIVDIQCALESIGADPTLYKAWTIPGSTEHAFEYWDSLIYDDIPPNNITTVKDRVIPFLNQYLKSPP
jgi:acetyl esterase/lipase